MGVINGSPLAMGLLSGVDPDHYLETSPEWVRLGLQPDLPAARQVWHWARERHLDLQALALQWSMREARIGCTLVGAKTAAEVRHNIEAATMPLPDGIWEQLEALRTTLETET